MTTKVWFANDGVDADFVGTQNRPRDGEPKVYWYRLKGDRETPDTGFWISGSVNDHPDIVWRPQPLAVQNAKENRYPGLSQSRFHPIRRNAVYAIVEGREYERTPADQLADERGADPHWLVSEDEKGQYPPPLAVGDWWRYALSHQDPTPTATRLR